MTSTDKVLRFTGWRSSVSSWLVHGVIAALEEGSMIALVSPYDYDLFTLDPVWR